LSPPAGDRSQTVSASWEDKGTLEYDMGSDSHSFHSRAFLNTLYAVCTGTVRGLLSAHSRAVTYSSECELGAR
jgi:hypothetical protein